MRDRGASGPSPVRIAVLALSALLALVALVTAGCGIPNDSAPRDIALAEQPINLQPAPSAVADDHASSSGPRVYFLVEDQGTRLEPTGRKVGQEVDELLQALL